MSPKSSLPFTLGEHRELGQEIKAAAARMSELGRLVHEVYGGNSEAAYSFLKVLKALDALQSDLETQAAFDLPGYIVDGIYR
jgi:hypothetical protein